MRNTKTILREGTGDDRVWRSVYDKNEYNLVEDLNSATIVDIGANIGAFSCLAADRGAKLIVSVEASASNYSVLKSNIETRDMVVGINKAIWTEDEHEILTCSEEEMKERSQKAGKNLNLGGWHVGEHTKGDVYVKTLKLSTLMKQYNIEYIDLLKIDCESSEWPLFLSMLEDGLLSKVGEVVGEYHIFGNVKMLPETEDPIEWLSTTFEKYGFTVQTAKHPMKPEMLGWFYCRKKDLERNCIINPWSY